MAGCGAILYQVADQPLLEQETVRRELEYFRTHPDHIVGLAHNGVRGNPCIFPRKFFPELMALEGDVGGNVVIRAHPDALLLYETSAAELRDVDTVETLFTAGIISMAADACRILSILIVVWQCSRGLAYLLLALLPVLFLFTRFVQKRMLRNQLKNRKAVSRASGYVPETVRNLRTIRTLGKETYMESRYDGALGESYRAIEGTNFYDALYSPVILTVNAAVVGA
ncbi:MAG: NTP transferase domain-containing protein, partial [Firmicutes bacterium]|nr:NTP transferase domain-containing protein [Bacillota bacterium]